MFEEIVFLELDVKAISSLEGSLAYLMVFESVN